MKRLFTIFMCMTMLVCLIPSMAFATVATTDEAKIGDVGYATLEAAVAAAEIATSETTIDLLKSVAVPRTIEVSTDKKITLNLGGNNIFNVERVFGVNKGEFEIAGTGEISISAVNSATISVKGSDNPEDANYTTIIIGSGVTLRGDYGIFITPFLSKGSPHAYGAKIDFAGKTDAISCGIYVNGQIKDIVENCPKVTIRETADISAGEDGAGVYIAGYTKSDILGGTITGGSSAIAIKAGVLNISGNPIIHCTGPDSRPTEAFSNGVCDSGASLQIESNKSYAGEIEVNISGGTLKSDHSSSIYEYSAKVNSIETPTKVKSLKISGGTFIGGIMTSQDLATASPAKFEITGGTFSDFSVLPFVKDNGTVNIKLQDNLDLTTIAAINRGMKVKLDLNGKTITEPKGTRIDINSGELTVDDKTATAAGKIAVADGNTSYAVIVKGNNATKVFNTTPIKSKFVLNKGTIRGGGYGIYYRGNGAEVVINGGKVEAIASDESGAAAISGNGSQNNGGTKLTITGGEIISDATITNKENAAIYHPQKGTVDISGGTFTSDTVLSIKDGTFNISGGVFNANGDWLDPATINNNGSENAGACVNITSNTKYVGPTREDDTISVNITGGTYISANGNAVYEGIASSGSAVAAPNTYVSSLKISGGTFVGNDNKGAMKITGYEDMYGLLITGGEYSSSPATYVHETKTVYTLQYTNKTTYLIGAKTNPILPALPTNYSWQKTSGNIYRATYNAPYIPPVTPVTPAVPTTPVVEEPVVPGGVASSTTNGTTTAKVVPTTNGTQAIATVNTTMGNTLVQKAVTNNSAEVVINAVSPTTSTSTAPKSTAVELPKSVVTDVVNRTEADVVVEANAAAITIDQVALKEINGQTTGNKITIAIDEVEKPPTAIQNAVGSDAKILKLEVKNQDGTAIKSFNLGRVTVTTAIPTSLLNKDVRCIYVADNGTKTLMPGEVVTVKGVRYYEFMTNHFSYYALVPKAVADKAGASTPLPSDSAPIDTGTLSGKIRSLKLTLRSTKYSSGIKVNWKKSVRLQLM